MQARKAKQRGLGGFPHERLLQEAVAGLRPVEAIEQEALCSTLAVGGFSHERLLNPLGLNMAEIELSVLNRQCLNRRLREQDNSLLSKQVK